MASDRGYSATPDGFVFVSGDIDEIVGALPTDALERVQVNAGYGVFVPSDVKLPKGISADKEPDDHTPDTLAQIVEEPVIEVPAGEAPVEDATPAENAPATDSTAATAE